MPPPEERAGAVREGRSVTSGPMLLALLLAALGAVLVAATGQGTRAGALAGLGVSWLVILGLGPAALAPLAVFVLGSGGLTKLGSGPKEATGAAEPNRGRRGARHVAAKLGPPALIGVAGLFAPGSGPLAWAYAAALAGAFADTAATELGPLAGGKVAVLRNGRLSPMPHGTPGGVSAAGLAASGVAAAAVSLCSAAAGLTPGKSAFLLLAAIGFAAALLESALGGMPISQRLGHFGRNVLVSAVSAAAGFSAAALGWGRT
jgi:uncharacterized protein (TIGR00297 family)